MTYYTWQAALSEIVTRIVPQEADYLDRLKEATTKCPQLAPNFKGVIRKKSGMKLFKDEVL